MHQKGGVLGFIKGYQMAKKILLVIVSLFVLQAQIALCEEAETSQVDVETPAAVEPAAAPVPVPAPAEAPVVTTGPEDSEDIVAPTTEEATAVAAATQAANNMTAEQERQYIQSIDELRTKLSDENCSLKYTYTKMRIRRNRVKKNITKVFNLNGFINIRPYKNHDLWTITKSTINADSSNYGQRLARALGSNTFYTLNPPQEVGTKIQLIVVPTEDKGTKVFMSTLQPSASTIAFYAGAVPGVAATMGTITGVVAGSLLAGGITGGFMGLSTLVRAWPSPYGNRVPDVITQTRVDDLRSSELKITNLSHNQRRIRSYEFSCSGR